MYYLFLMKKIINWGIIGLGRASLNLANEFKHIKNANLLAVSSLTKHKRDFFKKKFSLKEEYIYSSYNEILKNKDIDVIYIALPNLFHEKYCILCIKNNKNVLVEKPLTYNNKSFSKIKIQFRKKNLLLEEGTANKFHPFYKEIFKVLNEVDYKQINSLEGSFGNDALGGKRIFNFRLKRINTSKTIFNKNLFGGAILDGGIYPVSLLIDILMFYNKKLKNLKIKNCTKKISKNIDIESTLNLSINNITIKLRTSLINQLENNFKIITDNGQVLLKNIFNINSKTSIKKNFTNQKKTIKNNYPKSIYHYEISKISDNLIRNKIINQKIKKIEYNNILLSKWFNYKTN